MLTFGRRVSTACVIINMFIMIWHSCMCCCWQHHPHQIQRQLVPCSKQSCIILISRLLLDCVMSWCLQFAVHLSSIYHVLRLEFFIVLVSVGIDLKELGVSYRNIWNFDQGLKCKADFHSKMSICRHERGGSIPPPDNSNPQWTDVERCYWLHQQHHFSADSVDCTTPRHENH